MGDTPSTQTSLLVRLRDAQDTQAWQHFVQLYAPLVYRYARKHQLQDADAADVTQEVLHSVSKAIERLDYDPQRGSFRGWLFTLAHRRLCDFFERQKRQIQGSGDADVHRGLEEIPVSADGLWDREYEKRLFLWAKEEVRPEFTAATWQAFWRTAVDGERPAEVAAQLGMSVGAVYIARSRVQQRLREKIQQASND